MKVVLFCGGFGTRMREYSESIPKPMVNIGYRPILWHVMKYYAHYGHKDFILCLGYKADLIKSYFLNYNEWLSNNFSLSNGSQINLFNRDIQDWNITFVDTGLTANIGQRFKAVEKYLEGEEVFLANYSDGLTDLHLPTYIKHFYERDKIGSFLCVRPSQSFHLVDVDEDGLVKDIKDVKQREIWIAKEELFAHKYTGFFGVMDTFKEKQQLDDMYGQGERPWEVWRDKQLEVNDV
jgi:glucose-1-phosphate cytidylyltransferase